MSLLEVWFHRIKIGSPIPPRIINACVITETLVVELDKFEGSLVLTESKKEKHGLALSDLLTSIDHCCSLEILL